MQSLYKVRFTGQLLPGADKEEALILFSSAFAISEEKARRIFIKEGGTTLKKDLPFEKAERFKKKIESLGMEVELVAMESEISTSGLSLEPIARGTDDEGSAEEPKADSSEDGAPTIADIPGLALEPFVSEAVSADAAGTAKVENCPKCGSEHIEEGSCLDCGIIIAKYLEAQERVTAEQQQQQQEQTATRQTASEPDNPYAVPQADLIPESEVGDFSGPETLSAGRGWYWLSRGFWHFRQNPFIWIGMILVWILGSALGGAIPLVGPILSLAITVLSPVIMAGFILGADAQENGEDLRFDHLLAGFSCSVGHLILVGVLYFIGLILIIAVIAVIMGGLFSIDGDMGGGAGVAQSTIVLVALVGMALSIPLLMAYWFAPALIALEGFSALTAMKLSFLGCVKNIVPFLIYGVISALLLIVGSIPVGLGLLVVIPMISASVYTACRDIYYS